MTDEHKAAMAEGRKQSAAVRRYLEALESNKPKRGRRRTVESMTKRLATIEQELASADLLTALSLRQERVDLQAEISRADAVTDLAAVEEDFVASARAYGERKGISYDVWREAGVPAEVLRKAGISRGS